MSNTKALYGAILEARQLGEALLDNPNRATFTAYRRALTHLAGLLATDIDGARAVILEAEFKPHLLPESN